MKHIIEVSRTDIDHIIVADLKNQYSLNEDNRELMNAIEVVLQYYMKPTEYTEWFRAKGVPLDSSYPDGDGYWNQSN